MNLDKFRRALKVGVAMRDSQKAYFEKRDPAELKMAKRLEKQFDTLAAEALAATDLFEEKKDNAGDQ